MFPSVRADERLQNLWVTMHRRPWRSLAVVGMSDSVNSHEIAELLAKLVWWYEGQVSSVLDLRDLSYRLLEYYQREVRSRLQAGSRVIVALRPPNGNPTTVPLAETIDAVMLCVDLGKAGRKATEEVLAALGRDRVLGSIVLRGGSGKEA